MIKIALILLITLSVISTGGFLISRNALVATSIAEDKMAAIQIMNMLKGSIVSQGGNYYVPFGENDATDNRHYLPDSFGINRFTSNGAKVIYCPYSSQPVVTANEAVTVDDTTAYDVGVSNALRPGVNYVIESDAPPVTDLLAAFIMPRAVANKPTCDDLSVDAEGRYELTNGEGRIYAITNADVGIMYREGVNELITSAEPSTALGEALTDASLMVFDNAVITLEAGESFSIPASFTFRSGDTMSPRIITIKSSSPGTAATITAGSPSLMSFDNVKVNLQDITLSSNVSIDMDEAEALLTNVTARQLSSIHSDIIADGLTVGSSSTTSPSVYLDASRFFQKGDVSFQGSSTPIVALMHSEWTTKTPASGNLVTAIRGGGGNGGILAIGSTIGMRSVTLSSRNGFDYVLAADRTSRLTFANSSWNNVGSVTRGFYLAGTSVFRNATLNGSAGVQTGLMTEAGAVTEFSNSNLGTASTKFNVGWNDNGSASISGNGSIYAATCMSEGRFKQDDTDFNFEYNDQYAVSADPGTGAITLTDVTRNATLDVDEFFINSSINCL